MSMILQNPLTTSPLSDFFSLKIVKRRLTKTHGGKSCCPVLTSPHFPLAASIVFLSLILSLHSSHHLTSAPTALNFSSFTSPFLFSYPPNYLFCSPHSAPSSPLCIPSSLPSFTFFSPPNPHL